MCTHHPNFTDNNWQDYLLAKNLPGGVVAVYRSDYTQAKGYYPTLVASYEYDAWGKVIAVKGSAGTELSLSAYPNHIAHFNPIRYRGYYYDNETGFYYLQSRYYDPVISRFINADATDILAAKHENFTQYNLFTYCFNNPVSLTDDAGSWPNWLKKAAAAVAVVAVVTVVAAVTVATAGAGTAVAAVAVGAAKGAAVGMVSGALSGAAGGAIGHRLKTGSWEGVGQAALNGAADGALSGAISGAITGGVSAAHKYGTFSSKSSLTEHFAKHGDEFGDMYSNAKEYARGAKYVIKNGTYIPEKNAYIKIFRNARKSKLCFRWNES